MVYHIYETAVVYDDEGIRQLEVVLMRHKHVCVEIDERVCVYRMCKDIRK